MIHQRQDFRPPFKVRSFQFSSTIVIFLVYWSKKLPGIDETSHGMSNCFTLRNKIKRKRVCTINDFTWPTVTASIYDYLIRLFRTNPLNKCSLTTVFVGKFPGIDLKWEALNAEKGSKLISEKNLLVVTIPQCRKFPGHLNLCMGKQSFWKKLFSEML